MAPLVLVTGSGTGIGKTTIAAALVSAWAERKRAIAGLKPIESGVPSHTEESDAAKLGRVSTFHVTRFPPPYVLEEPVSPHLAARRAGTTIDIGRVVEWVSAIRSEADGVLVELPGGLFTPLGDAVTNADLALALGPSRVVLVAPNRLGVLHDVIATTLAAHSRGMTLDGILLSEVEHPDPSSETNLAELRRVLPSAPVLATFPRAAPITLLEHARGVVANLIDP